jgi:hypothetical protein
VQHHPHNGQYCVPSSFYIKRDPSATEYQHAGSEQLLQA